MLDIKIWVITKRWFAKKRIITNNLTRAEFEVINQKRADNGFDMTIFKEVGSKNADKAREF